MRDRVALFVLAGLMAIGATAGSRELDPDATGYYLRPQTAEVIIGQSLDLQLVFCHAVKSPSDTSPEDSSERQRNSPPPLDCASSQIPFRPASVTWKLEGAGTLNGAQEGAVYRAPATLSSSDRVLVKATLTYDFMKTEHILVSEITIVDADYTGTFSSHEVTVNSEYTSDLSGTIRWNFDEFYEVGGWREYSGTGTAALNIQRKGCGGAAFTNIPVDGTLKLHRDKRYEFQINLLDDQELTRTCHRPDLDKDLHWEETFTDAGTSLTSADHCGEAEFYPQYDDARDLSLTRNGRCSNPMIVNEYQDSWSFKAAK